MRSGVRLAVDVGKVRVGVARSDPDGLMAVPVATASRAGGLAEIEAFVAEFQPIEIVVGLPLSLAGNTTPSTEDALSFARELRVILGLPVRMVDERLSTVSAVDALRLTGRTSKKQRPLVDQVAAVILLQHTLDTERSQGVPAGFLLDDSSRHD